MASLNVVDADPAAIYAERPLLQPRDIRILDIEPSDDFDEPVRCTLRVASLDSGEQQYQTLSYAWGDPTLDCAVVCNDRVLGVTQNLHSALKRIRQKVSQKEIFTSTIWIDAICINQASDGEKSVQVAMMGDIYASCQRLIIWLGEASTSDLISLRTSCNQVELSNDETFLLSLVQKPWFQRRWVIPEVVRSPRAKKHVLLGEYRLSFDYVIILLRKASQIEDIARIDGLGPIFSIWDISRGKDNTFYHADASNSTNRAPTIERYALLDRMLIHLGAKCSINHDTIYALRSISSDGPDFPVNYSSDFRDLLINFTKTYLIRRIGVEVLFVCAWTLRTTDPQEQRLPSWVPDWTAGAHLTTAEIKRIRWYTNRFGARARSYDFYDHGPVILADSRAGDLLRLRGWLCCDHTRKEHAKLGVKTLSCSNFHNSTTSLQRHAQKTSRHRTVFERPRLIHFYLAGYICSYGIRLVLSPVTISEDSLTFSLHSVSQYQLDELARGLAEDEASTGSLWRAIGYSPEKLEWITLV